MEPSVQTVPAAGAAPIHHRRVTCRGCDSARLEPILALGPQPLANALPADPADFATERFFPLDVVVCADCHLVQIVDVIAPSVLFDHYLYVTGTSETIARHNQAYAQQVVDRLGLTARDLVVEIASNDGSLLSCFQQRGVRTLGVEPARNIAQQARQRGIETLNRYFDGRAADDVRAAAGPARAVIANNVLAHVDDPVDFLRGARALLARDGLVIVEFPYAGDMLASLEYDTIYHEHLCYFAIAPLARLATRAGLRVVRVDRVSVHGGSVRVSLAPGAAHDPAVQQLMATEAHQELTSIERWRTFGRDAARHAAELRELLERLRADGASLAAYGAPAKGNTLLNFARIGTDLLPFTVDRNPLKVGRYTPGMHLPVCPVDALEESRPDHVCILAWNFADEIMRQQQQHAGRGGRWIIPIPGPRIV